jgi:hypothetical protein
MPLDSLILKCRYMLPSQAARSITTEALTILKRVWKCRLISPVLKTFTWKLIRRALSMGQRAGGLSSRIDKKLLPLWQD